jgi:hypothetical protein
MPRRENLPLYRFKGDILRKLRLSPEQTLRITFKDSEENGFEIDDIQQIPTMQILEKRFPDSEEITVTAFFNNVPIKEETIFLHEEISKREENESSMETGKSNSEYTFISQLMKQQEILSELKMKSFIEITNLKLDGMKAQFEEMLKSKESIYMERLEIEREKVKLESGIESEGLLFKALSNAIDQVSPHLGDIALTMIEKFSSNKSNLTYVKKP